ncbi:endoplasmic reticulum resident protein 44-like [Babylonia areolata]|uniref:endoplasmic reticulum resident protein 44-like n=1 Tax=Babylonia areolata TaxID=304850 RepID=UPI003FD098A2
MSSMTARRHRCGVHIIGLLIVLSVIQGSCAGDAVSLNNDNINSVITTNDVVFVNFYADWCRFSQILAPTFDEASRKVSEEFTEPGRVVFAKVDCDSEVTIASQYRISKYPTLKLFRNGQMMKKEYRGQRSAEALANFVRDELKDPVVEHSTLAQLDELNKKKRNMIGYFESKESENYRTFTRVASLLRDDCSFHAAFGAVSASERTGGDNIGFRPPNTQRQDVVFMGILNNFDQLYAWAYDKCVPLVREITFENAEELTEEGLPFLIMFHHPDDTATVETYTTEVAKQLLPEKNNVNFLVADGTKFTHPLHHLGKSVSDLPVLAIDSFRHMYIFPHNIKTDLGVPGLLKQFVEDLHSGKLHREFHHGPDPKSPDPTPTPTPPAPSPPSPDDSKAAKEEGEEREKREVHLPKEPETPAPEELQKKQQEQQQQGQKQTQPPESMFKKLAPSRNRYTILRDEL